MTLVFRSPGEAAAAIGARLGPSAWTTIEQGRIDRFADATGDHQWIHVDPARAAAGPFGACIAHGYLTLSLINLFLPELLRADDARMAINYGCDRVRFPAPVLVGARIRGVGELLKADRLDGNAVQTTVRVTVEIEGGAKPGCVADVLGRYYF